MKTMKNKYTKKQITGALLLAVLSVPIPFTQNIISNVDSFGTDKNDADTAIAYLESQNNITKDTLDDDSNNYFVIDGATFSSIQSTIINTVSEKKVVKEIMVPTSAYNSEVGQTDDSPFITADGSHVRWGIVAANFLPIGTQIRIPDYYGDQIFEVRDRMNKRYTYKMDIWMAQKSDARAWGVKSVRVEILG